MTSGEILFQVQYQTLSGKWHAYGSANAKHSDAIKLMADCLIVNDKNDQLSVVRLVSVWQTHDGVWRVREVLEYRECNR